MLQHSRNIAIFGGTFDPIHYGHLLVAEQAYNSFSLDHILFMPAGTPPHKADKSIVNSNDRLKMVELAIQDNEHFFLSDYELKKMGKSYTAETLRYFSEEKIADRIYFIIGADSLLDIFNWREPDFLLENGFFIIAKRPGYSMSFFYQNEKYKPYQNHIHIMNTIEVQYSSTKIRELLKEGKSIKYQTPDVVVEYIEEHQLYRG